MITLPRRTLMSASLFLTLPLLGWSADATAAAGGRVALRGYDPVSYFTEGHPEKGSAEFAASFDDATYWFKTAEHRSLFTNTPDRYAPQYSGFCAMTVAHGEKAEPDPEAWMITDGKLYVFQAKSTVSAFRERTDAVVTAANRNWPALRNAQ